MLTSASNIAIKDSAPKDYPQQIFDSDGQDELIGGLETCLVSEEGLAAALENDYEGFLNARSKTGLAPM